MDFIKRDARDMSCDEETRRGVTLSVTGTASNLEGLATVGGRLLYSDSASCRSSSSLLPSFCFPRRHAQRSMASAHAAESEEAAVPEPPTRPDGRQHSAGR